MTPILTNQFKIQPYVTPELWNKLKVHISSEEKCLFPVTVVSKKEGAYDEEDVSRLAQKVQHLDDLDPILGTTGVAAILMPDFEDRLRIVWRLHSFGFMIPEIKPSPWDGRYVLMAGAVFAKSPYSNKVVSLLWKTLQEYPYSLVDANSSAYSLNVLHRL